MYELASLQIVGDCCGYDYCREFVNLAELMYKMIAGLHEDRFACRFGSCHP